MMAVRFIAGLPTVCFGRSRNGTRRCFYALLCCVICLITFHHLTISQTLSVSLNGFIAGLNSLKSKAFSLAFEQITSSYVTVNDTESTVRLNFMTNDWEDSEANTTDASETIVENSTTNDSQHDVDQVMASLSNIVDCHPDSNDGETRCKRRHCHWKSAGNGPRCLSDPRRFRYILKNVEEFENHTNYTFSGSHKSGIGRDSEYVRILLTVVMNDTMRVHISDPNQTRQEAPVPLNYRSNAATDMNASISDAHMLTLQARDFDVTFNLGQLMFTDVLVQTVLCFPEGSAIFGYDANVGSLNINTNWQQYFPYRSVSENVSGDLHAFFLVMLKNGYSAGIYLHNSNFMRVSSQPGPCLSFITLGGNHDFYVIGLGQKPVDVLKLYWELVGYPMLPSIAALQFESREKNIYYVSAAVDERNISKIYETLGETWEDALAVGVDVRVKDKHGNPLRCSIEGIEGNITLFDFSDMSTFKFWGTLLQNLCPDYGECSWKLLFLDVPRCFNLCKSTKIRLPIDVPGGLLPDDLLCVAGRLKKGTFHNVMYAYAYMQAHHSHYGYVDYIRKRPNLVSDVTFAGQGRFSGHLQLIDSLDIKALRNSVVRMLAFNMYGIPFMGTNLCGGLLNAEDELCAKLNFISSWFPVRRQVMFKSSKATLNASASGNLTVKSMENSNAIRNELFLYLYTLLYNAHKYGEMVSRPLFVDFPSDPKIGPYIDKQFMFGWCLMVSLDLDSLISSNNSEIRRLMYLPRGVWYNWLSGQRILSPGSLITIVGSVKQPSIYCRGGSIIPISTHSGRVPANAEISIVVCPDINGTAKGNLFRDEGSRVAAVVEKDYAVYTFSFTDNVFTVECHECQHKKDDRLISIKILGLYRKASATTSAGISLKTKAFRKWTEISGFSHVMHQKLQINLSVERTSTLSTRIQDLVE